jgi:hypothetical protein
MATCDRHPRFGYAFNLSLIDLFQWLWIVLLKNGSRFCGKVHYTFHKNPLFDPVLSQLNPAHTLTQIYFVCYCPKSSLHFIIFDWNVDVFNLSCYKCPVHLFLPINTDLKEYAMKPIVMSWPPPSSSSYCSYHFVNFPYSNLQIFTPMSNNVKWYILVNFSRPELE